MTGCIGGLPADMLDYMYVDGENRLLLEETYPSGVSWQE